jgi:hypothetical protein
MTPLIRKFLPVVLTFALAGLAPLSAVAKELRHPESGLPAYVFELPDDWTSQAAPDDNLILFNPTRSGGVVILVAASTETIDAIAAEALATSKATQSGPRQPAEISGFQGYMWPATMQNAAGVALKFEMTVVRIDDGHVASASLLLSANMSPAEEAAARAVWKRLKLEAAAPTAAIEPAQLPDPILVLGGMEYYQAGGREWTRYKYYVENSAEYPDTLFAAAPDLPPCGSNKNSSRTWVDFFAEDGKRLHGFCALQKSSGLGQIWFAVPTDEAPPGQIYIELIDRRTDTRYKSNLAPTSRDPRLK